MSTRPGRPWRLIRCWPAAHLEALDGRGPDVDLDTNVEAHRERCGTMTRDHSRHLRPLGSSIASVSGSGEHLFGTSLGTVRTSSGGSGSARLRKPDELPRASRGSAARLRDRCNTANAPDAPFPARGDPGGWLHQGFPSVLESRRGAGRDLRCYRPNLTMTADPATTRASRAPHRPRLWVV